MSALGLISEAEVPSYVAHIIRHGVPLYFSGGDFRRIRLMAVRAPSGTAILELRAQRECSVWSVVTAFSGSKKHGTMVGTVLFDP